MSQKVAAAWVREFEYNRHESLRDIGKSAATMPQYIAQRGRSTAAEDAIRLSTHTLDRFVVSCNYLW